MQASNRMGSQQLLKVEPALWTFVTTEGIEPTNNAAEWALRPAVLWRKNSFASQGEAGSLFVSRMLTMVTTFRSQNRPVLDYLVQACRVARRGQPAPFMVALCVIRMDTKLKPPSGMSSLSSNLTSTTNTVLQTSSKAGKFLSFVTISNDFHELMIQRLEIDSVTLKQIGLNGLISVS